MKMFTCRCALLQHRDWNL